MFKFGLLGKNIDYSFSRTYFTEKFKREKLEHSYENFDIDSIGAFPEILSKNNSLKGLNVTIPYKEEIIQFLDELDTEAKNIGAVNTIKFTSNGLKGYNTDHFGFKKSLEEFLPVSQKTALILGTGGASKAVAYALKNMGFTYRFVSRNPKAGELSYSDLNRGIISNYFLIVNSTPLGTYPKVDNYPDLAYEYLSQDHLLFDLIYNPKETEFLRRGKNYGARTVNGYDMLKYQAEKAWEIWNS